MTEQLLDLQRFFDAGGPVLWAILFVAIVLWTLIIERYWHHWRVFPGELAAVRAKRRHAPGMNRRLARRILEKDVSELRLSLTRSLFLIRTMIAVCPLLGLLGTVTGMILVFDTIEISGTGNPRAMAAGVSMATIPTMAGLVVALSGFVFSIRLQRGGRAKARQASDVLLRDLLEAEADGRKSESNEAKLKHLNRPLPLVAQDARFAKEDILESRENAAFQKTAGP